MDKQLVLGERTFSFGVMPAIEALRVEVAIMRVIGEPLFKAFMAKDEPNQDQEAAGAAAIGMLLANLDADTLESTMQTVFKYVNCDGKRIEINATFTGRNKELWQVFIHALRINFADFFPEKLLASVQAKVTAA